MTGQLACTPPQPTVANTQCEVVDCWELCLHAHVREKILKQMIEDNSNLVTLAQRPAVQEVKEREM